MTTLEKIKAEILDTFLWECETEENLNDSVRKCLEIIDKYAEQEPTSPCDLCRYDYLDGYCGDCPAMAKGGE